MLYFVDIKYTTARQIPEIVLRVAFKPTLRDIRIQFTAILYELTLFIKIDIFFIIVAINIFKRVKYLGVVAIEESITD